MTVGVGASCGACKFLRRKCTSQCVFAPYFRYELASEHFGAIHKVFGASNASRVLAGLPEQWRSEAAIAMSFEALARIHDPVYGCVAYIYALQQQVTHLQHELDQALVAYAQLPTEGDWIMEDCSARFGQLEAENNLGSLCSEFIPFDHESPLEAMMSEAQDIFSYLPLMQYDNGYYS